MIDSTLIVCLCLSTAPASLQLPGDADQRRLAVERSVTTIPWVEGHPSTIEQRMRELNVPGVSVAVVHEGRLDWAAGYGVRELGSSEPVETSTVFQAASISKPVAAMVTMSLAQEGALSLDGPVNELLSSWQLPSSSFEGEITPRHLLSHTGGLGVHGFPGYRSHDPLPSLVQILDGSGPANTGAVRRIEAAGERVRYSGGGSTLMQLALTDLTGKEFHDLARERVLEPLGMQRSTYAQPLPVETWSDHSAGHGWGGRPLPGRFHTYPEAFPAGLWTTPSDLTRFLRELQRGFSGSDGSVLDSASATLMLTPVLERSALGLFIEDFGGERWFGHGGSNQGFKCQMYASFEGGRAVVVMTNGDQGSQLAEELVRTVAHVYGWPGFGAAPLEASSSEALPAQACSGRYGFGPDDVVEVREGIDGLVLRQLPSREQRLAPLGGSEFLLVGSSDQVRFGEIVDGQVASLSLRSRSSERALRLDEFERWPVEDLLEGEVEAALEFYREVHAANPADPMVARDRLMKRSVGHWNAGDGEAGLAMCALLCELFPRDANAWDTLAALHAQGGDHAAAATAYRTCLERIPEDPTLQPGEGDQLRENALSVLRVIDS